MVPAALLLLVVVVQAAAILATRAQARLHPSRPCQRAKQCSGVTARNAPKTENRRQKEHPLANFLKKSPYIF